MNSIQLVGYVGKDPDMQYTEAGVARTTFSLAVKRPFKKDITDWFDVTAWRKTAELVGQYVQKGAQVGVVGRVEIYEKDGAKRYSVVAENVSFLARGGASQRQKPPAAPVTPEAPSEASEAVQQEFPGAAEYTDEQDPFRSE